MILLSVDLCPEILTPELISVLDIQLKVRTVQDFIRTDPYKVLNAWHSCRGPDITKILHLRTLLLSQFSAEEQNLGKCFLRDRFEERNPIRIHLQDLDELTSSNLFKPGHLIELFGCPGSGKTQFAIYLATKTIMSCNGNVVYLDTRGDFCVERFLEMVDERKFNDKIRICQPEDLDGISRVLNYIWENSRDNFMKGCRLLVLDNISSIVQPLLRDNNVSNVFGRVSQVIGQLKKIASKLCITILVINNATTGTKDVGLQSIGVFKPALGKILTSACDTRLFIQYVSRDLDQGNQVSKITVHKSMTVQPGGECLIKLSQSGLSSAKK